MAGLAHGTSGQGILESSLRGAISRMSGMATRASSGIGIGSLPACQQLMPVIGAAPLPLSSPTFAENRHRLFGRISSLGHILVAL
jgi:hypothetical protein